MEFSTNLADLHILWFVMNVNLWMNFCNLSIYFTTADSYSTVLKIKQFLYDYEKITAQTSLWLYQCCAMYKNIQNLVSCLCRTVTMLCAVIFYIHIKSALRSVSQVLIFLRMLVKEGGLEMLHSLLCKKRLVLINIDNTEHNYKDVILVVNSM